MKQNCVLLPIFLCGAGLFFWGCDNDDPSSPPQPSGTIEVNASPDSINASWQISGPDDFETSGSGDQTLNGLVEGTYTMEWGEVVDWERPNPHIESKALVDDATVSFIGVYLQTPNCSLVIDPNPDFLNAPWVLNGPDSFSTSGSGGESIDGLFPGEYTLIWGNVRGYLTPSWASLTLLSGDQGDFSGEYIMPSATTPDILVQNFETIYVYMLIDDFRDMLHNDYKTVLLPSTLAEWQESGNPLSDDVFNRVSEISIHENMFSGQPGMSPVGVAVSPIESVTVDYMAKVASWEQIPEGDEHFGGLGGYWARYDILIYFNHPDQFRFMVEQDVEFFVIPVEEGGTTIWRLLGQRGLEPGGMALATEQISFGSLKALYR